MSVRPGGGERVYRALLGLYPVEFRRRFGEDMVQLFHDRFRDARSGRAPWGAVAAWTALLADVALTASHEHLRRNRTVAHSLATAPSVTTRILGLAGIAGGLVILAAYVIDLPSGVFRDRLIVFAVGVSAIGIGVQLRQSARAPMLSLAVTVALVAANALFVFTVIFLEPGNIGVFWSGLALWLASAAFGGASAMIGAVTRIGGWSVAVGSLLALTGIDRLGLVSESNPTYFNTLSQVGIVIMALGWILLGLDVAFRRTAARQAS